MPKFTRDRQLSRNAASGSRAAEYYARDFVWEFNSVPEGDVSRRRARGATDDRLNDLDRVLAFSG